ncbi:TIGR00282 family metallophosphoesterase [Candidatus Dependentiae bacterium]|nr:TIGR00282 family metallophosphoesterase [Candidatus Dependentiae bacterium]
MNTIKILLFGDICGASGRAIFQKHIARLREQHQAGAVIVNGENSASSGKGITSRIMHFFKHHGVNVVTSGNHIWAQKEIYNYLKEHKNLLRPANFPSACPGVGVTTFEVGQWTVGVINLQARTFMREFVACPFKTAESLLTYLKTKTSIIIVDFHGEATSEKMGLAYYLDGQVSAVVGTHTHVLTADERVLPGGTAYITDLGMAGALNSMIGMKKDPIIQQLLTQMPVRFEVETQGPLHMTGAVIEIDVSNGKAHSIKPIRIVDNDIVVSPIDEYAEKRHY